MIGQDPELQKIPSVSETQVSQTPVSQTPVSQTPVSQTPVSRHPPLKRCQRYLRYRVCTVRCRGVYPWVPPVGHPLPNGSLKGGLKLFDQLNDLLVRKVVADLSGTNLGW